MMTVKEWYTENYPTDDMGEELNEVVNFHDVHKATLWGIDIYKVIGVGDSLVRERLFLELSERLECGYNDIYDIWLSQLERREKREQ